MKKFIAILLALVMVLALCACGDSSSTTTTAAETKTETKTDAAAPAAEGGDLPTYEFIVQNHDPSTSICAQFLEDWCAQITEATDGRVQFVIYHGGALGSGSESIDLVINGTADICWTSAGMYAGRFAVSEGWALAGIFQSGVEASAVMDDFRANNSMLDEEWGEVKVLGYAGLCGKPFATADKQLNTVEDFKGLRIRSTMALEVDLLEQLGATPMSFSIVDSYENLEKSVCDGVLNDWHNQKAFSLQDVLHYASTQMLDFGQHGVFMNWDTYNSIDADTLAIIEQYTGEYLSNMMGEYWDSTVEIQQQAMIDAGNTLYDMPEETWDAVIAAGGQAFANWVVEKGEAGYATEEFAHQLALSVKNVLGEDRLEYLADYL